ncbi:MAG: GxxExxY protein [Pirellulales bacterium]|nr:GxxExxY protein [Pirellulales bacterium]
MYEQEGYDLVGAAFEAYNQLGYGMAEDVNQQCLEIELTLRAIPFESKRLLSLTYKGHEIEKKYLPDLFVFGEIVVELKSRKELTSEHEAQLFNYMRLARQPVGYLLNFGAKGGLQWKRYLLNDFHKNLSGQIAPAPSYNRISGTLMHAN